MISVEVTAFVIDANRKIAGADGLFQVAVQFSGTFRAEGLQIIIVMDAVF